MKQFCIEAEHISVLNAWVVIFFIWAATMLFFYFIDKKNDPTKRFWKSNFSTETRVELVWRIFLLCIFLWTLFRLICTLIWGFQ